MEEFEKTNRLKLPLLIPNQSGKEFYHNEALIMLDNMIQNCVIDKDLPTPPENVNTGDIYIISHNATDDWINKENQIAIYDNGWRFIQPEEGFTFYIKDEQCFYTYVSNIWIETNNLFKLNNLNDVYLNNLSINDLIVYNGEKFINTKHLNLESIIFGNNKIELKDNNLVLKYGNNSDEVFTVDNNGKIDFKNGISVSNIDINDIIINTINDNQTISEIKTKANIALDNITTEGENVIKNIAINSISTQSSDAPDYNATIQIGSNNNWNEYTAPTNGFFYIYGAQASGASYINVSVNNMYDASQSKNYTLSNSGCFFRVLQGDVISRILSSGTNLAFFIPVKTE